MKLIYSTSTSTVFSFFLGLYSLAKRLDALGGKYGVRNRDDGRSGTAFWFAFPYRPDFTTSPTSPVGEFATEVSTYVLIIYFVILICVKFKRLICSLHG